MIVAGCLLLPNGDRRCELSPGWLRISAGRIAEIHRGDCPHTIDLGGDESFITPGFIDTHVHLPQFDGIGCDGLPLLEWLNTNIFPMERRWEDPTYAAEMTERVLRQFLSHGTTSFCAYATVHHAATVAALELAQLHGLRACIGQTLMDRLSPDYLTRPTKQQLAEVRLLLEKFPPSVGQASSLSVDSSTTGWKPVPRVEFGVTPRFAASCTPELMQAVAVMAKKTGAIVQTHLAETIPECQWIESLFDGKLYTEVYHSLGLLGERTILGHGIYLREEERQLLRKSKSVIAHCPNANVFLQSGIMPRWLWQEEGLRISLGSDIGAGFDVSMPCVARAMIDAAKYLHFSEHQSVPPTAAEAWYAITTGNADAAGWPQIGRLAAGGSRRVGHSAGHPMARIPDPLAMLLYAWESRWIDRRLIAGALK